MADSNSKATVVLEVNGQQASQTLEGLREIAIKTRKEMEKAAAAGDAISLRKLKKGLTSVERSIRDMESTGAHLEKVLSNLGKATPNELQRALITLQKHLKYVERGTKEWEEQVAKIKAVKNEISVMNNSMKTTVPLSQRIIDSFNKWAGGVTAAALSLGAVVAAGRKAVQSFADMDEQLANTRKYTGMTVEQVNELNESFKNMNTRTSREALNELAQEAGRLGKTTLEDVQGYVEAADIINVALEDLGEGATQEIAKLANIFGVEKAMGTKNAMLAIGSTINVLSQNCTASKPYLVEFTQRMAGIGAQAKMSVPELVAFGAVLDANGQKSEMASSALGKLTMMIFQDPAKMAKQAGLNVEKFTETMKRSTSDGLVMFLERVKELGSEGGLSVLAPLFKDLGADGVRMSQVLATLATHVDEVKWQFGEANKAFREATSATKEYNIFNNTTQAGLDKAKKNLQEIGIQLGEKLVPIMSHVLTRSSAILKILQTSIEFIYEHRKAIMIAGAAVAAYTVTVNAVTIAKKAYAVATKAAEIAQKGFNSAMSANHIGLALAALAAAILAFKEYADNINKAKREIDYMGKAEKNIEEQYAKKEAKLKVLVEQANNENLSLEARKKAIKELNKIVPEYNAVLDETAGKVRANTSALDSYLKNIRTQIRLQAYSTNMQKAMNKQIELEAKKAKMKRDGAKQGDIDEVDEQIAKVQHDYAFFERNLENIKNNIEQQWIKAYNGRKKDLRSEISLLDVYLQQNKVTQEQYMMRKKNMWLNYLDDVKKIQNVDMNLIKRDQEEFDKIFGKDKKKGKGSTSTTSTNSEQDTTKSKKTENTELAALKKARADEEAAILEKFASGKINLTKYNKDMLAILNGYYADALKITSLKEDERNAIIKERDTARSERVKANAKTEFEAKKKEYEKQLDYWKEQYAKGLITRQDYEHRSNLINQQMMTENNRYAREWGGQMIDTVKAEKDRCIEALQELRDKRTEMMHEVFGTATNQDNADYEEQAKILNQVKEAMLESAGSDEAKRRQIIESSELAILELKRKYYQISEKEYQKSLNKIQNKHKKFFAWLNSEEGQVVMSSADTIIGSMTNMFSQLNSLMQAEVDAQTAAIESNYEGLMSRAEGNKNMEVELERQKNQEIADIKNAASKKMYAMEVMTAVAEGAMAAINAYQSAAAIPIVGFVLGPIAAAAAAAATGIQIATIKKQQQAAESTGYAEGGFTRAGRKYDVVGVVHAGEWVASQELVNSPVARPVINTLEQAQRTNTIASLRRQDVSDTITAPATISRAISTNGASSAELSATLAALTRRLNEPFVTVNTVSGNNGINKALQRYEQLKGNK